MECDAQRAGIDAGAEDSPCPTRRRILGGLAVFAAAATMSKTTAAADQYEAAFRYLHGEFMGIAPRMAAAEGKLQEILYRRMITLATALTAIPALSPYAWRLKREVAAWSLEDGGSTMLLPYELVVALTKDNPS